jgi:Fe-S-cluster containining protein
MKKNKYEIININLTSIDSGAPISDVPCGSCTKCCEVLTPFLTPEELTSGLYPLSLIQPDKNMISENPNVGPLVAMFKKTPTGGCSMFIDGKCSIYDYRPKSCRQFDCRSHYHPATINVSKEKVGIESVG